MNKLETRSIFPQIVAAVGPDYGVGEGVEVSWAPSVLEEGYSVEIPANYGTDGTKPNYQGIPKGPETGYTSDATAKLRSIGYDPGALPGEPLSDIPAYTLLPFGSWYNKRIPSVNKAATFTNEQTGEVYGYAATFQSPVNAQLLSAVHV